MPHSKSTLTSALAMALTLILGALIGPASPAARADQYDPPAGYYDTATATSSALLRQQLHNIIDNHIMRSYGDARQALAILDVDPNNVNNLIAIYDGTSLPKIWDAGVTWNREHTWPRSRGVGTSGPDNSDLHMLRPAAAATNGSRGNDPYGTEAGYFDPGAHGYNDRGQISRTMFYAAVRYDGTDAYTTNLTLVDFFPSGNQMALLSELLEWHFAYPPDQRERRRNELIWDTNPQDWYDPVVNTTPISYGQGNRNPFVDHPEYAWVIWGVDLYGPNDATLYVGPTHAADGSSSTITDLGRAIAPATVVSAVVPIEKDNDHPAAYRVSVTGAADSPDAGLPRSYPFTPAPSGVSQPTVTVGTVTSGPGTYSGTVIIHNAQLTSAGTGEGSADADDTINVTATILNHSNASFDDPADTDTLGIDFGSVPQYAAASPATFAVHNLSGAFLAGLDLDSITSSGDTTVLTTNLASFSNLASGAADTFSATLDTDAAPGAYSATYTLHLSDEDVPGEASGQTLTLTLQATIAPPSLCVGDLNASGATDVFDFGTFIGNFGAGPGATHAQGDLNGDGYVNVLDFSVLAPDFGCGT